MTLLQRFLADMPVVAILRGLSPEEALPAFDALVDAGIRIIEVPLNSPRPLDSLRRLVAQAGDDVLIGAGTVLTVTDLRSVAETGARLMVAPNCEPAVIAEAKAQGLMALPGVATPSEAFAALRAGADALKMFPGEMLPPAVLKAWRAVLPAGTQLLPVGGVNMENMAEYVAAGAAGFGIGSALYKPGIAPPELGARARKLTARCRELFAASGKV
ncbi:MAG: 2-dehydro-3-deoxyphosphogalactonate aldolase [Rhodospirillaceae bacterium]|jgi:2-dehydro-3-deoxyphosphogalactonate aldolase|nr:2-dehydro-3-deoxyphosphogalactonate aldolase [Rhodospirillaceae bacterium]